MNSDLNYFPVIEGNEVIKDREDIPDKIAVCLNPIWDSKDWLLFAEFIEFYRLQGVEKIFIHYGGSGSSLREVLERYITEEDPLVHVTAWKEAVSCHSSTHCQMSMLQDCMFRTMFKYRWVLFTDLDELVLIDKGKTRLRDFLNRRNYKNLDSIIFRLRVFARFEGDPGAYAVFATNLRSYLPLERYAVHTSALAPPGFGQKYICKPELFESVFVHYTQRPIKEANPRVRSMTDARDGAFLAHFRSIPGWESWYEKTKDFGNYTAFQPDPNLLTNLEKNLVSRIPN